MEITVPSFSSKAIRASFPRLHFYFKVTKITYKCVAVWNSTVKGKKPHTNKLRSPAVPVLMSQVDIPKDQAAVVPLSPGCSQSQGQQGQVPCASSTLPLTESVWGGEGTHLSHSPQQGCPALNMPLNRRHSTGLGTVCPLTTVCNGHRNSRIWSLALYCNFCKRKQIISMRRVFLRMRHRVKADP